MIEVIEYIICMYVYRQAQLWLTHRVGVDQWTRATAGAAPDHHADDHCGTAAPARGPRGR